MKHNQTVNYQSKKDKCYCGAIITHTELINIFVDNKDVVCHLCNKIVNAYILNQSNQRNYNKEVTTSKNGGINENKQKEINGNIKNY